MGLGGELGAGGTLGPKMPGPENGHFPGRIGFVSRHPKSSPGSVPATLQVWYIKKSMDRTHNLRNLCGVDIRLSLQDGLPGLRSHPPGPPVADGHRPGSDLVLYQSEGDQCTYCLRLTVGGTAVVHHERATFRDGRLVRLDVLDFVAWQELLVGLSPRAPSWALSSHRSTCSTCILG